MIGRLTAVARNLRVIQVVLQIVGVALVALLIWWLLGNLRASLEAKNIPTDFGFLTQPTNFDIPENRGFDLRLPVWRMLLIAIQNTVLAAAVGIVIATVLGVIIGVARLSTNWIVSKLAQLYVETFRNIPTLVIIVFISFAVFFFGPLPSIREATEWKLPGTDNNWIILSKVRIAVPSLIAEANANLFWVLLALALGIAWLVGLWRQQRFVKAGESPYRFGWFLGTFVVLAAAAFYATGSPFQMSWPVKSDNNFEYMGGFSTSAAYLSVTIGLGLYTASQIAETVRGSILAVPRGQSEAAYSVALSSTQRYRCVVLPQAFRIAMPAITNSFLNLTKNTSLGAAIGYAELATLTRSSYSSTSPAAQAILIMMCAYLTLSLLISLGANMVNRSLAIKER